MFDISRVTLESEYLAEFKAEELFTDEVHLVNMFASVKPNDTWKISSAEYFQIHSVLLYSQQTIILILEQFYFCIKQQKESHIY